METHRSACALSFFKTFFSTRPVAFLRGADDAAVAVLRGVRRAHVPVRVPTQQLHLARGAGHRPVAADLRGADGAGQGVISTPPARRGRRDGP